MSHENIVNQVRERVIATGASQMEIARSTGMSQTSISRFLRGDNNPTVKTLYGILKFAEDWEIEAFLIKRPKMPGRKPSYVAE